MRKDVILGMSIGGVLLAIVVVYLAINPGHKNRAGGVDTGTALIGSDNGNPETDPSGQTNADAGTRTADAGHNTPGATVGGAAGSPAGAGTASKAAPATGSPVAKTNHEDKWAGKLEGKIENRMLLNSTVVTHTPDGQSDATTPDRTGNRTATGSVASGSPEQGHAVGPTAPPAAAPESPAATHTHVIAKGETLSSIATTAYGSPNYYPHILRANPTLNPNRMKPGMTINLPDLTDVHPPTGVVPAGATGAAVNPVDSAAAEHGVSVIAHTVDAQHEYVVQSGDSLHKIAIKLYGKISMVDKIYDMNKEAIGPDKARLKLHMVLKLPQPPMTVAAQ